MAKLYFRHGTVSSAKTLNLLSTAHNYRQQGKQVLLLKPAVDTRFGVGVIKTRAGLEMPADIVVDPEIPLALTPQQLRAVCVLVDEAQFMPVQAIDYLHRTVVAQNRIPVICYGLRSDFRTELFPAAKRLLELADSIEEVKTICHFCLRKAVFNLKMLDGKATLAGPSVELGCEEKYLPACKNCYYEQHGK
jgi:thymidine kinase